MLRIGRYTRPYAHSNIEYGPLYIQILGTIFIDKIKYFNININKMQVYVYQIRCPVILHLPVCIILE